MDIRALLAQLLQQQVPQEDLQIPPVPPSPAMPMPEPMPVPPGAVSPAMPTKDRPTDAYKLKLIQLLGGGPRPYAPEMTLRGGAPEDIMATDPAMRLAMMRGAK